MVICDRFVDSTLAYQVYGKKVNINFIRNIHKFILRKVKPNITFILKVSSNSSKQRLKKEKQKIDMISFLNHFTLKFKNLF